jgi:hypothetical protein
MSDPSIPAGLKSKWCLYSTVVFPSYLVGSLTVEINARYERLPIQCAPSARRKGCQSLAGVHSIVRSSSGFTSCVLE